MSEWIKIKTRPMTDEEMAEALYPCETMYDCLLPDSGQEVLVTTREGYVAVDTFCEDVYDGYYFETYCDEGDVIAWMPLPEPYKEGVEE